MQPGLLPVAFRGYSDPFQSLRSLIVGARARSEATLSGDNAFCATGCRSRDLNCRPPFRLFIEKLSADLATNFLKIKAAVLERASFAVHSLNVSLFVAVQNRGALRNRFSPIPFACWCKFPPNKVESGRRQLRCWERHRRGAGRGYKKS